MKDFAGSSITYYGLAREKLMDKYPRLINVLVILALICMTGLAIFLISDLVSFASNPDYKGASVGLDLSGINSTNSSQSLENTSIQTREQSLTDLSKMNASLLSSQTAKGVVAASKSSSSSSQKSVNEKSGNSPVIRHHSSSSSSSSTSSSAKSAKKINETNNLTNETATIPTLSDQPMNNSQGSNDSEVAPTAVPASLPSAAIGSSNIPAKDTPAREPVSIIKFKTQAPLSPKSKQGQSTDNGVTDGAAVSDNTNNAQSSNDATKKSKLQTIKAKSASSQKSKLTATNQAAKVKETRDKMRANKDRIEQNMKKKAAQLRSKAANN